MRMSPPAAPVFSRGVGSGCQNFPPVQRASQSREMRPEKNLGAKQRKIANVNNSSPFSFSQEEFAGRREGERREGKGKGRGRMRQSGGRLNCKRETQVFLTNDIAFPESGVSPECRPDGDWSVSRVAVVVLASHWSLWRDTPRREGLFPASSPSPSGNFFVCDLSDSWVRREVWASPEDENMSQGPVFKGQGQGASPIG